MPVAPDRANETKVDNPGEITLVDLACYEDVCWLDVPMHQLVAVRFVQDFAYLFEQANRPTGFLRTKLSNEALEVDPTQEFHRP